MKLRSNMKVLSLFIIQSIMIVILGLFLTKNVFDFSKVALILSAGIVLSVHLFLYVISNYKIASVLSLDVFMLLTVINYFKVKIRNTPFIFTDFKLINEVTNVKNLFTAKEVFLVVSLIVIFNVLSILSFRYIYRKIDVQKKDINKLVFIVLMLISVIVSGAGLRLTNYSYEASGVYYSFVHSFAKQNENTKFSTADKKILYEISKNYTPKADEETSISISEKDPNIIFIMNEAFWDVNLLQKATLTPDPMEAFYKIQEKGISGYLQVPVFGGGTSNTEFEILTGYSTHIYDDGYMMYTNEMDKPIMSLASVLKSQGYNTSGIHSFWGWYYNRNGVYKNLGFDKFIVDEYMNESTLKGYYISDDSAVNEIIDEIDDSEAAAFIYCVTMQNHGPYDDKRYDKYTMDINIETDLPKDSEELIQVYAQGVYDASKSLEKLVNYVESTDENTVIVFFGDHLPLLGDDLKVYKENGFINEEQSFVENAMNLNSVPFVIWSNFKNEVKDIGVIDSTFLGSYVLDYAQVEMPNYYKHILDVYNNIDFVTDRMIQDKEGNIFMSDSEEYINLEKSVSVVQRDMMYGKSNIEDTPQKWINLSNNNYNSQLKEMMISKIDIEGNSINVYGTNFYDKSKLFINDIEHKFIYVNDGNIIIENVDLKIFDNKVSIKMELYNTIEQVIAKSNEFRKDIYEENTN